MPKKRRDVFVRPDFYLLARSPPRPALRSTVYGGNDGGIESSLSSRCVFTGVSSNSPIIVIQAAKHRFYSDLDYTKVIILCLASSKIVHF